MEDSMVDPYIEKDPSAEGQKYHLNLWTEILAPVKTSLDFSGARISLVS